MKLWVDSYNKIYKVVAEYMSEYYQRPTMCYEVKQVSTLAFTKLYKNSKVQKFMDYGYELTPERLAQYRVELKEEFDAKMKIIDELENMIKE